MQKTIIIEYMSGDKAEITAYPPDFARWEKETGKRSDQISGIWDILFVAYCAFKRQNAGKAVKPFEIWMDSVADFEVVKDDPKATQEGA